MIDSSFVCNARPAHARPLRALIVDHRNTRWTCLRSSTPMWMPMAPAACRRASRCTRQTTSTRSTPRSRSSRSCRRCRRRRSRRHRFFGARIRTKAHRGSVGADRTRCRPPRRWDGASDARPASHGAGHRPGSVGPRRRARDTLKALHQEAGESRSTTTGTDTAAMLGRDGDPGIGAETAAEIAAGIVVLVTGLRRTLFLWVVVTAAVIGGTTATTGRTGTMGRAGAREKTMTMATTFADDRLRFPKDHRQTH